MKDKLYQKSLIISLLVIASLSLLLTPNSIVSLLGIFVMIPLWIISLIAYFVEYENWSKAPEVLILLATGIFAIFSRSLLNAVPIPLELRFLLGIMVWGGVGSVAIALFIRHTIRNEQSAT